jgi:Immunity protein 35
MTTTPPAPPEGPITRERATEIAREAISGLKKGTEFVLDEQRTIEKEWGWVFGFCTKEYLESRSPMHIVPGTGPLVVEKADGDFSFLSTSVPPNVAVAEYERRRAEGAPRPPKPKS